METRTVGTRMTPDPDLAAKASHTAAPVRLGGGREHAQDKRGRCQHCHQSSHHLDVHLVDPSSFKIRAVVFSSNSLSKRAFNMHSHPQLRLNAAARLGPIVLKTVS